MRVAILFAILVIFSPVVIGCPMCRTTLANSDSPAVVSAAVNGAILVLLVPTLALIGSIVVLVVRRMRRDTFSKGIDPLVH